MAGWWLDDCDCFVIRHEWGDLKGWHNLNLAISGAKITCDSIVFASATEVTGGPGEYSFGRLGRCSHLGAAPYTIHNISTSDDGKISIKLHVDWGSPLRTRVDYLVINPPVPTGHPE